MDTVLNHQTAMRDAHSGFANRYCNFVSIDVLTPVLNEADKEMASRIRLSWTVECQILFTNLDTTATENCSIRLRFLSCRKEGSSISECLRLLRKKCRGWLGANSQIRSVAAESRKRHQAAGSSRVGDVGADNDHGIQRSKRIRIWESKRKQCPIFK
jgi:hypothetical protein